MKYFVFVLLCIIINNDIYSQKEASVWTLSPNATLDFNTPIPVLQNNAVTCDFLESSCCISDEFGNLLFYSDGDTLKSSNNNVVVNGSDLSPSTFPFIQSTTQGSLFVKKPGSPNLFYLFSLGFKGQYDGYFSYSLIDKNLNSGQGEVISSQNLILNDTLTEKMAITKHCNNIDYWVVIINLKSKNVELTEFQLEFRSYLLTSNGINLSPIKSIVDIECPMYGQLKFNNAGTELAFAENSYLKRFTFDKASGTIALLSEVSLPLENGYGIEFSPNDSLIYINEKQYDLSSSILTKLQNYSIPSQLQRAPDGKIYGIHFPNNEVDNSGNEENGWFLYGNIDQKTTISTISFPNVSGVNCQYIPNSIIIEHPSNYKNYITLPYFPSFYFNHKPSDFSYTGTCEGEEFNFFITNSSPVDSVLWNFHETGDEIIGLSVDYTFSESGDWQVSCTVYQNGVATTSTQCVNVCGINNVILPSIVDLCENDPFEINALNTCSVSYKWNTGDTTSAIFIDTEGEYILETTNECGVFYDTMEVIKSDICNLLVEIPNVITVNNDNINDVFSINAKNVKSFNYSILNRWGNLIYSNLQILTTSQYNYWNTFQLWDGKTSNGLDIIDGTYFYHIDFTLLNNEIINKSGFIEVVH